MKRQHQSVAALVCAFVVVATCAQAGAATTRYAAKARTATAARPFSGVAGPYSSVSTSPNLNCSVVGPASASEIFADTAGHSACGTFIAVNGAIYGPGVVPAGLAPGGYTPVSQTTHGSGTPGDPQITTTVVAVGATGLTITQTDTWTGNSDLQTTDTVANTTGASQSVQLSRALDCLTGGDDTGYGVLGASWLPAGSVGCQDVDEIGGPGGQILTWIPVTAGSTAVEDAYQTVWNDVAAKTALPNSCQCANDIDNGMATSWGVTVGAHASTDVSSRLDLVPSQLQLITESLTNPVDQVKQSGVGTGEADWTITVTNTGPVPIQSPTIAIDQPSAGDLDLDATSARGSDCSANDGPGYECQLDDLAPGASVDLRVVIDTSGTIALDGDSISISLAAYPEDEAAAAPLTESVQVFAPQPGLVAGYTLQGTTLQLKPDTTPPVDQTFLATAIGVKPPRVVFAPSPSLAELLADPELRPAKATPTVAGTGFSGVLQSTDPGSDVDVCGGAECQGALALISPIDTATDAKHPALIKITWGAALGSFANTHLYLREPSDAPGSPGRLVPACVKVKGFLVSPAPGIPSTPCLAKPVKITSKGATDQIDVLAGDPTFGRR